MSKNERYLRACRRQPTDATPIWLMRQAGRYMPEYRALRKKHELLEMIKTPDLATEVTLQPIRAFDLDAAIVFADILPVLESLGLPLEFISGKGPVIDQPIRSANDVARLQVRPPRETLDFTLQAIRQVQQELNGKVPLIGFSGAPFTLACYAIEGGGSKNYVLSKTFMYSEPEAWHALMDKLAEVIGHYLRAQVDAGADALQLFDSWVGSLSPADYREYVMPYSQRAIEIATRDNDVPLTHFGTATSGLLPLLMEAGGDVIGVDWRLDLAEASDLLGEAVAIQGNLDPVTLFAPVEVIEKRAQDILDAMDGRPGHIFNLGHGILPGTPVEHVAALIETVHAHSAREPSLA